jgi:succinate-acetate transporter protein
MSTHAAHDHTANPAPLGLLGFGMTTILLNLHNAGLIELSGMILAMGIFYGGICQVCAGLLEWKKGNTFGTVAFTSYGFFWLSLVAILVLPKTGLAAPASEASMAAYLGLWGILTLALFVGTLRLNRVTQLIFGSLVVLFALLSIGDATSNAAIKTFAGWEGLVCGAAACYAAFAQVLNEMYGRVLLPLGDVQLPANVMPISKAA